jgi:3-polyprenyl-4-hydroxybenzoate decarboxylase
VWNQLEAAGIPGVQGVWTHEAGGSRFMLVVSIKTLYGGHSKQAGMVASHCHAGAYNNRWTIVVDDDIDPTNFNDVIWAMCTRCDPRDQIDIIHGGWSSALDPMCYDTEHDRRNSRVVIDACIRSGGRRRFPKSPARAKRLTIACVQSGQKICQMVSKRMFRQSGHRFAAKNMLHSRILERVPDSEGTGHALSASIRRDLPAHGSRP